MVVHRRKYSKADVSSYKEGAMAAEMGVNLVATTLSGYTEEGVKVKDPDFKLISRLSNTLTQPIIA